MNRVKLAVLAAVAALVFAATAPATGMTRFAALARRPAWVRRRAF